MVKSMLLQLVRISWVVIFLSTASLPASATSDTNNFRGTSSSIITETNDMNESLDLHWWLSSGAYIYRTGRMLSTIQGKLADNDRFRLLYAASNPIDTDNGYRPQNILRLVTRTKFKDFTQQFFFTIKNINTSESPNRNQSNGVFLFNRYQDSNNLYYLGIRVDGYAVVKKKLNGVYNTLKSVAVYQGSYNRDSLPNMLPINRKIGIRTVIANNANGNVDIMIYLNDNQLGSGWTKILQVEDTGIDVERILNEGYAGIRSDFMDIQIDDYEAIES